MTSVELAEKLIDIAENYKTLYVMGCFGAPMNDKNKARYTKNHSYNKQTVRQNMINSASADTFGFDCVNLIKGVLWGWCGDTNKNYGGATYKSNDVPDTNADGMIKLCKDVSTDFTKIEVGEYLWLKGHAGIYIGNGLAVECTPLWDNKVQITAVGNIDTKLGYHTRTWSKHGKLPYINYIVSDPKPIKAGDKVILNDTPCYSNSSSPVSYTKKSGTFYYWDNVVINGKIKITNSVARVGVKGQVTCWISVK